MLYMNISENDPAYQPSSGFDNSVNTIDPGIQWPPKVEDNQIDDTFLQGILPECLTISERQTVSKDFYWYELLKQFPYLIAQTISYSMSAENQLKQARAFQIQSEDTNNAPEMVAKAKAALICAQDTIEYLYKAKAFLTQALKQFDPKLNPSAYFDAKDGTIIKATALQCDFSLDGIKAFNNEIQTRTYFKDTYSSVNTLFQDGKSLRAVTHKGLLNLMIWIEQGIMSAQNIIREYQHLEAKHDL